MNTLEIMDMQLRQLSDSVNKLQKELVAIDDKQEKRFTIVAKIIGNMGRLEERQMHHGESIGKAFSAVKDTQDTVTGELSRIRGEFETMLSAANRSIHDITRQTEVWRVANTKAYTDILTSVAVWRGVAIGISVVGVLAVGLFLWWVQRDAETIRSLLHRVDVLEDTVRAILRRTK